MHQRNEKKLRRKENKKKKLKALLEISSLNDQDRKNSSRQNSTSSNLSGDVSIQNGFKTDEPNPKRIKRDFLFPLNGQEKSNEVQNKKERTELTEEQNAELKRLLKMRKKIRHDRPFLDLNEVGEAASVNLKESQRVPLPFDDFQHFIITSLFAHMGTKGPNRWINFKKHQKLERRIIMIIEGAGIREYLENKRDLKTLPQFEKQLEVLSPMKYGGDLINELAVVSLTNSQRKKLVLEYGSMKEAYNSGDIFNALKTIFPINDTCSSSSEEVKSENILENKAPKMGGRPNDNFSRKLLLLSPWDMVEENYPLPVGELRKICSEFVFTRDNYTQVSDKSPMWALDCEMCLTSHGSELTRVCIVDEDCNIVYESLVKPKHPIQNYLTRFSGITAEMMRHVNTRLEDVQADIRAICPPDLILVGQSLNMDLNAMKMIHPFIIDTSFIFNMSGVRERKTKLRILVEEFLSLRIQANEKLGHSPIEDAIAAMKLVQAKLTHSPSWGNALLSGPRSKEESSAARMLLESREAAGLAHIPTEMCQRLIWPQLVNQRDQGQLKKVVSYNSSESNPPRFENICSTSLFSHLVRYNKNAALIAKKSDLDRWAPYYGNVNNKRFHVLEVDTNRAAVKYVREHTPADGSSLAYVTLTSQQPENAIIKADKLTEKLMKNTKGNTVYSVLLAGSTQNPGNGILFLHLARQTVPIIPQLCNL